MKIYGLTGNIGSGKSTVAEILRQLGAHVIDADDVAREIMRPGEPALQEVVLSFGRQVLRDDGTLDRKILASIAFSDEQKRKTLNRITHPKIERRIREKISTLKRDSVVFIEASLIDRKGGAGLSGIIDGLVVVSCPAEIRKQRAVNRLGVSTEDICRRIAAQLPEEKKAAQADFLIQNSSDLESLRAQVLKLWNVIVEDQG